MKVKTKAELKKSEIMYRSENTVLREEIRLLKLEAERKERQVAYFEAMNKELWERVNHKDNPWQSQHGGKHYAELTIQPLQYTLGALGYEAFKGACHNHVARYTTRKKDGEVEQLKKAKHILEIWIYEAENKTKGGRK